MDKKEIRLDDAFLSQVSGGAPELSEGSGIACPKCAAPLPKGSGGVMTDGEDGGKVLQFECVNPACAAHYYEISYPDLVPTGRVWDYNGKRI